jgi:hypothetical protein
MLGHQGAVDERDQLPFPVFPDAAYDPFSLADQAMVGTQAASDGMVLALEEQGLAG